MPSYRCYLLDHRAKITDFIELQAESDEAAIGHAREYADLARRPFELWRGSYMVFSERTRAS